MIRYTRMNRLQQRPATKSIDEPYTGEGEDEIGHADAYRLQKSGLGSQARQLKRCAARNRELR